MSVFPMIYQPSRLSMKLVHILRHGDCRPVGVVAPPQHDLRRAAAEAGASQSSPCGSFLRYASGTSYLKPGTQLLRYPGTQLLRHPSTHQFLCQLCHHYCVHCTQVWSDQCTIVEMQETGWLPSYSLPKSLPSLPQSG